MFGFKKKFQLVIVCTANRTRSAYFLEYLRNYLTKYRPEAFRTLAISSAGTKAINGGRANDVVALIARNNGFSLRAHGARKVTRKIMDKADLVLVMEQVHKDDLCQKFPLRARKVHRLMEYGWQGDGGHEENLDVPDPTGKAADDFKEFIETAHGEADRLIHELIHQGVI